MLSKPTSTLTTGTLAGLFTSKVIHGNPYQSEKLREIYNLELGILGVATGQYAITFNMPNQRLQRWRYFDWIITTPLLLKTFHSLAEEKGYQGNYAPAFAANILMIVSGYIAEFVSNKRTKMLWYAIGIVSLLIVLYHVKQWDDYLISENVDTGKLAGFFYIGWTAYGLNFMTPQEELRQTGFNILDLFNKGVYTFELDKVLKTI